jgi:hypothetical protein
MAISTTASAEDLSRTQDLGGRYADKMRSLNSAISWGAIVAGAVAAAALSLILLILGVGLGLSSVSPWAQGGVSATTFGVSTIIWLTLTQLLASAMGGYLAGRLRTKWLNVHSDEVYFRDTAHGFLSWAVSCLVTAALLTSVIGSILSGGAQAGASMMGGIANTAGAVVGGAATNTNWTQANHSGPMGYLLDALFRRDASTAAPIAEGAATPASHQTNERASPSDMAEISRIFTNLSLSAPLPDEDIRYVGQIVAQRTGLSQQNAEKRVASVYVQAQARVSEAQVSAREATDKARKASAYSALWLFVSLLVGAFVSGLAATFGGRSRDALTV